MVFTERALLHNPSTISELEHQRIALLVAKELAEQVESKPFNRTLSIFELFPCFSGMETLFPFNGGPISGFNKPLLTS